MHYFDSHEHRSNDLRCSSAAPVVAVPPDPYARTDVKRREDLSNLVAVAVA